MTLQEWLKAAQVACDDAYALVEGVVLHDDAERELKTEMENIACALEEEVSP